MTSKHDKEKAVLLSIKPEWCELIANGKKTLELRTTIPKLETLFKCYIYCTKEKNVNEILWTSGIIGKFSDKANGKIIGEFTCDYIVHHCEMANADIAERQSCVKREKIFEYSGGKEVFGWHISDLKIYDRPRELSELGVICEHYDDGLCGHCEYYDYANNESYQYEECAVDGLKPITRPPRSWCYVKEREKYEWI